jgi:membrane protein implicated in regulation of membrane protease activity
MDWMSDHSWVIWLGAVVALAGIEMITLDLLFAMLSAGALAGLLTDIFGAPFPAQIVVACVVAVAMIAIVRPIAVKHLRKGPESLRTNIDALLGVAAVALQPVDATSGRVKIGGEVWSARALDPGEVIEVGETVSVAKIDGATAVVTRGEVV